MNEKQKLLIQIYANGQNMGGKLLLPTQAGGALYWSKTK